MATMTVPPKEVSKNRLKAKEVVTKITDRSSKLKSKNFEFELVDGLITLSDYQQSLLLKSLEIYFPKLYVKVKHLRIYDLRCEADVDRLLKELDLAMSDIKHFRLYNDINTLEYEFLRKIRLRHMTK